MSKVLRCYEQAVVIRERVHTALPVGTIGKVTAIYRRLDSSAGEATVTGYRFVTETAGIDVAVDDLGPLP